MVRSMVIFKNQLLRSKFVSLSLVKSQVLDVYRLLNVDSLKWVIFTINVKNDKTLFFEAEQLSYW